MFCKRTIMKADANRPKKANLLKTQRSMPWVRFEKFKFLIGKFLYFFRELPIVKPEFG